LDRTASAQRFKPLCQALKIALSFERAQDLQLKLSESSPPVELFDGV
jgi:hypothetical protein